MHQTRFDRYDNLFPFTVMDPEDTEMSQEWLCQGLIMRKKINVLFGAEKAGKSRLMAWVLAHLYARREVFGKEGRHPGKTLYLAGEETRQEVTGRLVAFQDSAGIPPEEIDWAGSVEFCEAAGMRLDHKVQREWLAQKLRTGAYQTLIVDPLRRVHGASESSNDEMAPICNDLRDWTNRYGITMLLIHHTGKLSLDDDESRIATWSRGATDLPAVLDWAMYAKRIEAKGQDRIILRRKGRAPKENTLVILDGGDVFRLGAEVD